MKMVIASDIHGYPECCAEFIGRYREERAEKLLLLGDILHGSHRSAEEERRVCELLREFTDEIICVRGNCDHAEDAEALGFELHDGFTSIEDGGRRLLLTHGHVYNENRHPKMESGDLLLCGHTHEKIIRRLAGGGYVVNPGSVSRPRDGKRGSYAVYDGEQIEIKYLDGETALSQKL